MKKMRKAAALKYENGYDVPIVTAAGVGYVADRILEKAEENKIPVVKNETLAELLNNVEVGSEIPDELYDAVAKIIVYVMDLDKKASK